MKRKYIIIIILIILILIVASILLYIKNKNQEPQNIISETNTSTTTSNNETIDEPANEETGGSGEEYSRDHIKGFDFTVLGLTPENTSRIQGVEDFKTAIKEYAYKKGLTNADEATLISTAEQGNILQYVFKLTENKIRERGIIIAHVNIKTNKYNFGHKEQ